MPIRSILTAFWLEPQLILKIVYTKVTDKLLVDEATEHNDLRFSDIYSSVAASRLRNSPSEIRGDGGEMVEEKKNGYDMELKIQRKKGIARTGK